MIPEPAPSPTPDRQRVADALAGPLEAATALLNRQDLDGDTLRSYRQTLPHLCTELGGGVLLTDLTAEQTAAVFATARGTRPPVPGPDRPGRRGQAAPPRVDRR